MGVRFACHACGKRLNIKTELAGKRGICPACSVRFRIPPYDTEVSTPIEAEEQLSASGPSSVAEARTTNAARAKSTVASESVSTQDFGGVAVEETPQNAYAADTEPNPAAASNAPVSDTQSNAPPSSQSALKDVLGDSSATWYVRPPNGGQYGPADGPTMGQWLKEGRVADLAMVWRDGWTDWRLAKDAIPGVIARVSDHLAQNHIGQNHVGTSAAPSLPKSNVRAGVDGAATETQPARQASDLELTARSGPLGSNKQKRSRKRVVASITLGLVFVCLIGALVFVLTRG